MRKDNPLHDLKTRRCGEEIFDTVSIPENRNEAVLDIEGRKVKLTNLRKPFWPELRVTKGDLLRYYRQISPVLLPHLLDRALVMKRYPNGAAGKFFFQKRAPAHRPDWIEVCSVEHASGNVIDFPIVRSLPSLLWIINLGCIDLNPWYGGFRYLTGQKLVGSLLLGLYGEDGLLHHVGYTSSFKGVDRKKLTQQLEALRQPPGFTGRSPGGPSRWAPGRPGEWEPLIPERVAEVMYDHFSGGRFGTVRSLCAGDPTRPRASAGSTRWSGKR